MTYFVYLLKSDKDGQFYIGQTDSIERRLAQHNSGLVKATRGRRPLRLLGYERYNSRQEARFREYQLKHHSDKKRKFISQFEDLEL